MNYNDLEKIKLQIEKYGLIDEIPNVITWLTRLNQKQIENFLSLNINNLGNLEKYKKIIVNLKFMNDYNYNNIINKLSKNPSEICVKTIVELLADNNFLESRYYEQDLEFLFEVGRDFNIKALAKVARSGKSISRYHHQEDLKLIADTWDEEKQNILVNVARNEISLTSRYHHEDMLAIYNTNELPKAEAIGKLATCKYSVESNKHNDDVKVILESNYMNAPYLADVACNSWSLWSEEHEYDMKLIGSAKTKEHLECLSELAKNSTSIISSLHKEHMKILSKTKKENLSYMLDLFKKPSIVKDIDFSYLEFLSSCNNVKKVKYICMIIANEKLLTDIIKRNKILDIVKNIENEYILETIINIMDSTVDAFYLYVKAIKDFDTLENTSNIKQDVLYTILSVYNEVSAKDKKIVLSNKEKLDIVMNNAIDYKDSNQLPSKVFSVKTKTNKKTNK